jgi:mannose-6-phosphate isomerase-like protein (cupin superfamily)
MLYSRPDKRKCSAQNGVATAARSNAGLREQAMNPITRIACAAVLSGSLAAIPALAQEVFYAWAPKPAAPEGWKAPNKPVWRLPEILTAHQKQKSWVQPVVRDKDYAADYIQMAPGEKTRTRFYADDRTFFVVWGGQIRFTIQGQQPFVASKGFLVQVPYRTAFSMETVGDAPSLRFEVRRARAEAYYTVAEGEAPPTGPGPGFTKVSYRLPPDPYTAINVPYVDFLKDYVNNPANPLTVKPFVHDDHNWVNVIRLQGGPTPPPTNLGHFHTGLSEFWFIPEGKVDFLIEGRKLFTADAGDVVYAPPGRWHRASSADGQVGTRLAIIARPRNMHNYTAESGAKQ